MILRALILCVFGGAATAQNAENAPGGLIRVLDKMTGAVVDLELASGETQQAGRLQIDLAECRYPAGNPAGDAWGYLTILERGRLEAAFRGWMVASSPALNPLDHPRYDVWLLRCTTS